MRSRFQGMALVLFALSSGLPLAYADIIITPLDSSDRILAPGMPATIQVLVHNAVPAPLDGALLLSATDFWGRKTNEAAKPLAILPGEDRLITMTMAIEKTGYYRLDAAIKSGDAITAQKDGLWSLAILEPGLNVPQDSPFGTYIIGNTKMLADIVPKGFFSDMARMGARWGTIDTWWSRLEVVQDNYDWAFYEQWFDAARHAGIIPIPHLFGIPQWASSQPGRENYWAYPPKDWSLWERFVEDFVKRYQDWLVYLRIWNEPNCGYWQGSRAEYAQLLIHASQAAKRIKPSIQIIMEAVANPALDVIPFFNDLDAAGATPHWDVLAVHNYWLNNKECPEHTPFGKIYQDVIDWRNLHKPNAEVWDTEFACMADNWGAEWFGVGETAQAQWLARAYVLGFSKGLKKMFWFPGYSWPDPTTPPYYNPAGLLRPDLSPRPAFVAFHTIAAALSNAQYAQALPLGDQRFGLIFRTPDHYVTILWADDPANSGPLRLLFTPNQPVIQTNLMGENDTITPSPNTGELSIECSENILLLTSSAAPTP